MEFALEGKAISGVIRKIIISEQYVNITTKHLRETEIRKKSVCLLQHKGEESQEDKPLSEIKSTEIITPRKHG